MLSMSLNLARKKDKFEVIEYSYFDYSFESDPPGLLGFLLHEQGVEELMGPDIVDNLHTYQEGDVIEIIAKVSINVVSCCGEEEFQCVFVEQLHHKLTLKETEAWHFSETYIISTLIS